MNTATLLISCPDRTGIIAKVSNLLFINNCNIIQSDQYSTGHEGGRFFIRVQFAYNKDFLGRDILTQRIVVLAEELGAQWQLLFDEDRKRMGILVSRYDHCLVDLLYRWKTGEYKADIPYVISNHQDLRDIVESYGISYYHLPVGQESKDGQEQQILELVADTSDFLVLARYMQILSGDFLRQYGRKIINIHHSFLPSFKGANPYGQAWERGVKIIGATAHYVTPELDDGPIIAQEVIKVSHKDDVVSLTQKGRDVEKLVLSKAVHAHLDNRVIEYGNKTIVFE